MRVSERLAVLCLISQPTPTGGTPSPRELEGAYARNEAVA